MPSEIELKLDVSPGGVARLRRMPLLKQAKPKKPELLQSVYFDTDKQKLRKKGLSLRVRSANGHYIQTIKRTHNSGVGLFDRDEWEQDVATVEPDFDAACDTAEGKIFKKLKRRIKPVFETRISRIIYLIRRNGSWIELAIDKGQIVAAGRTLPLSEIELELKAGETKDLFALARTLDKVVPLQLGGKAKAERGYDFIGKAQPGPVKAGPIEVTPDMDWAATFKSVGRACLSQLVANRSALAFGDLEAVHQMRVGIRKLRAAISVFSGMLDDPQTETIKSELKWLTAQLGPAREFDVFVKRVLSPVEKKGPGRNELRPVARDLRMRRAQSLSRAKTAVASTRFRRLVLDVAGWIECGQWARGKDELKRAQRERSVASAAAAELRRRVHKLNKQGARLGDLDAQHRHKLRINAKKLRYACEFFAGAFPGKKASRKRERFISKLKELQNALGDLNDIVVHEELAHAMIAPTHRKAGQGSRRVQSAFAVGRLSGREEARFDPVMQRAKSACASFAKAAPFWR